MTGPEHYREGERLIEAVKARTDLFDPIEGPRVAITNNGASAAMVMLAAAQAHFAAAQAAATAEVIHTRTNPDYANQE